MNTQSEFRQLLKSYAEKTAFPLDELNTLMAKRRAERPRLSEAKTDGTALMPSEEDVAFRRTLETQRELLDSLSPPTTIITLDQPDTIELSGNQFPVVLFEPVIAGPFLSWARLIVDESSIGHSNKPVVTAKYTWHNPSPNFALINVGTLLRMTGSFDITANAGLVDGNTNKLDVFADLRIAINGALINIGGNLHQTIVQTVAAAGSIFGSGDAEVKRSFLALPVGLGADSIPVPPGADVSFSIDLTIDCRLDADASLGDEINVDFGSFTNPGLNRVQFPFLHVEVLT